MHSTPLSIPMTVQPQVHTNLRSEPVLMGKRQMLLTHVVQKDTRRSKGHTSFKRTHVVQKDTPALLNTSVSSPRRKAGTSDMFTAPSITLATSVLLKRK